MVSEELTRKFVFVDGVWIVSLAGKKGSDFHVALARYRLGGSPADWAKKCVDAVSTRPVTLLSSQPRAQLITARFGAPSGPRLTPFSIASSPDNSVSFLRDISSHPTHTSPLLLPTAAPSPSNLSMFSFLSSQDQPDSTAIL